MNEPQVYKDQQSQIEAVEQLLVQDIDALIIQPVDTNGANDVIQRACDACVAVVTLDTKVATEDVVTHVASDHENDGWVAAEENAESIRRIRAKADPREPIVPVL